MSITSWAETLPTDPDAFDKRINEIARTNARTNALANAWAQNVQNNGQVSSTSPDSSLKVTIFNPLRAAAIGQGWRLDYKIECDQPFTVVCHSTDEKVVSGKVYPKYISLKVGVGKATFTVSATSGDLWVSASFNLETMMGGG